MLNMIDFSTVHIDKTWSLELPFISIHLNSLSQICEVISHRLK